MDSCPSVVIWARIRIATFLVGTLIRGALVRSINMSRPRHPIRAEQAHVFYLAVCIIFWVLPIVESPRRWLGMICSVLLSVAGHLYARNRKFVILSWLFIYLELLDVVRSRPWEAAVFGVMVSELVHSA